MARKRATDRNLLCEESNDDRLDRASGWEFSLRPHGDPRQRPSLPQREETRRLHRPLAPPQPVRQRCARSRAWSGPRQPWRPPCTAHPKCPALSQRASPLHQGGSRLLPKKNRNMAAAAVPRKLTVAIWHLLNGHFTPLLELDNHLQIKLLRLASVLGKDTLKQLGFDDRRAFVQATFKKIQLST